MPSPWHLTWSLIMRKLGKVHVHQPSHEPGWTKLQGTYTQTWGALFSPYIFLYYLSCLVFQDAHGQSPYLQGDSSTNGPWSIAMFHYQEVLAKHQVINCESERACQTHGRLYIVVRPLAELCITCMLKHQHVKWDIAFQSNWLWLNAGTKVKTLSCPIRAGTFTL